MSTMNLNHAAKSRPVSLKVIFKGGFGLGMMALILVGAGFYLAGKSFTDELQAVAAISGAVVGAISAAMVGRLIS
jgi:hypothetical protein